MRRILAGIGILLALLVWSAPAGARRPEPAGCKTTIVFYDWPYYYPSRLTHVLADTFSFKVQYKFGMKFDERAGMGFAARLSTEQRRALRSTGYIGEFQDEGGLFTLFIPP